MRQWWRSYGGRNGRPGQCKPGCLPDDTVASLGYRGDPVFFLANSETRGNIAEHRFPPPLALPPFRARRCASVGSRLNGRRRAGARCRCQDNTGESTCNRAKGSREARSRDCTHPYLSSLGKLPTSNRLVLCKMSIKAIDHDRSRSIRAEALGIRAPLCGAT